VYIDAIRTIQPGEELGYDYQLTWESTDDPEELKLYACLCGAENCRGTMLDRVPLDQKRKLQAAKTKARAKAKTAGRKKPASAKSSRVPPHGGRRRSVG
jgi:hypothetical protein